MVRKSFLAVCLSLASFLSGCTLGAGSGRISISRETGEPVYLQVLKPERLPKLPEIAALQDLVEQQQGDLLRFRDAAAVTVHAFRFPKQFSLEGLTALQVGWSQSASLLVAVLDKDQQVIAARQTPALPELPGTLLLELDLPGGIELGSIVFATDTEDGGKTFQAPRLALGLRLPELRLDTEQAWFPANARLRQVGKDFGLYGLDQVPAFKDHSWLEFAYELAPAAFDLAANLTPSLIQVPLILTTQSGRRLDYVLRLRPGRNSVFLHRSFFGETIAGITIPEPRSGFSIRSVKAGFDQADNGIKRPLPADLGVLYDFPQTAWRQPDFEVFSWNLFPGILYFDFADYAVQAEFLKRLAFFVEKEGYQGRLLSDAELQGKHGYNAHNYNGTGLAAFFNAADRSGFALNRREEQLRAFVLTAGIISGEAGQYQPGPGGILSITRESPFGPGLLRDLLLTHEAMHGVFYESVSFYAFAYDYWLRTMTEEQRSFWRLFMSFLNYGPEDEYLMINELQAYLLQYPHRNINWYYNTLIRQRLTTALPSRKAFIDGFYARNPDFFTRASLAFNRTLFAHTGLLGGDVRCLVPVQR